MNSLNIKKIILPVVILIATFLLAKVIVNNPPKNTRGGGAPLAPLTVETLNITPQPYTVTVESFGTVQPRTSSILVAQVSGEINAISEQFRDGGFFEKGDVLVQLDDRNHRAEVKIKQSGLLSAKQTLMEEQARVKQALIDWQRLGNGDTPTDLVLRKPQLAAAQAQVLSAQANVEKAQLLLERTKVVAPYAGRILKKHMDLGRVVVNNSHLADIYAIDYVEIRLPINNKDLSFMVLPEQYRHSDEVVLGASVTFTSNLIGEQRWQGRIVRTEGAIDENSQQLYVVAQIDDPYSENSHDIAPIKIGQYVNAEINGRTIKQAMVIPNAAIYQGSYVYIVEQLEDRKILKRQEIKIRWQNADDAIIESGLTFGDKLVLTPLGQVSSGTPVKLLAEPPKKSEGKHRRPEGGPKKRAGKPHNANNKLRAS